MTPDEFAFNHHPEQLDEWFIYNGWRYKTKYDIRTKDGRELPNMYPNGNGWHGKNGRVPDANVTHIRFTTFTPSDYEYTFYGNEQERVKGILMGWHDDVIPDINIDSNGKKVYTPKLLSSFDE